MPPKKVVKSTSGIKPCLDVVEIKDEDIQLSKEFLSCFPHLELPENKIGIYKEIVPAKLRGKQVHLDTGIQFLKWEPSEKSAFTGYLTFQEGSTIRKVLAYQKMMPLVDPYYWLRYKERPSQPFLWNYQKQEIVCPENQGYVDCVASFLVSKLRNTLNSPHFCEFLGCFRAVADAFYYNLEDDFEEFRFTTWFWKGFIDGDYDLRIIEKSTGRRLEKSEILEMFKPDNEFLHDDSDSDKSSKDSNSIGAESLPGDIYLEDLVAEAVDIDDIAMSEKEPISIHKRGGTPKTVHSLSTASDVSEMSFTDEYFMHAELHKMPVAIQFLEHCEGTMDELLEQKIYAPIVNKDQETKWTAWLFQVCAACSQLQNTLRLTHNDLHTCNVLVKRTTEEFLYYSDSNGRKWKIPTFGYIFSIIDYGRAIFTVNNFTVISSDYNDGHDASGMYNFGPIEDDSLPRVYPNKSFDLCRLACSLLRGLFPKFPESLPKGQLITKEKKWEVRETTSAVFNLLWVWLRTKKKENVLETEEGYEKYPGFDLYSVIAKEVGDAVPEEQFKKDIFKPFLVSSGSFPAKSIFIPL